MEQLHRDTLEAQDLLARAKISQAVHANKKCTLIFPFKVGDRIWLSTLNPRREFKNEFKNAGDHRVAKFMPRYDGPYTILAVNENKSTVKIDLPPNSKIFPVFHTSNILPYKENDKTLFPSRTFAKPPPILNEQGDEEYLMRDMIDERWMGVAISTWCDG